MLSKPTQWSQERSIAMNSRRLLLLAGCSVAMGTLVGAAQATPAPPPASFAPEAKSTHVDKVQFRRGWGFRGVRGVGVRRFAGPRFYRGARFYGPRRFYRAAYWGPRRFYRARYRAPRYYRSWRPRVAYWGPSYYS